MPLQGTVAVKNSFPPIPDSSRTKASSTSGQAKIATSFLAGLGKLSSKRYDGTVVRYCIVWSRVLVCLSQGSTLSNADDSAVVYNGRLYC